MDFCDILRREREKRGMSLRDAAAFIGICHSYLSSLENGCDPRTGGELLPSPEVFNKICAAYDLDTAEAYPFMNFRNEDDMYRFMAKKLHSLKQTNPAKYREMLNIITEGKSI